MVAVLKSGDYYAISKRMTASPAIIDLQHAITGIHTEGAEMADALKRHLFYGTELDTVNLGEEIGDVIWYVQLAAMALGTDLEAAMKTNMKKLEARYQGKFSEDAAVNRDLDTEREILEDSAEEDAPEGWIEHIGHISPVSDDVLVDILTRSGDIRTGLAGKWDWSIDGHLGDIVQWRYF